MEEAELANAGLDKGGESNSAERRFNNNNMKIFKKIATVIGSALMIGATMGVAAAANYPAPFIQGGVANVALVYGENAAPSDVVGASNVISNLATALASQTTTGGGTSTTAGTNMWEVKTSADQLELGESIKDIEGYIGKDDLSILADGSIVNSKGTSTYQQFLYFEDVVSSMVNYTKDEEDKVGEFLFFKSGQVIARYVADFTNNLETDVAAGVLDDVEDEEIIMLGKTYTITNAVNTSSNQVSLTLMSGAAKGTITSGEELTVGGYTVSAVVSASNAVKFVVNGKPIGDDIAKGEIEPIGDGNYIAVTDIDYEPFSGGLHQATFWIGADKIVLKNGTSMEVNGENINEANVLISYVNTDDITISEISVNMTAEDDLFIPANGKLSKAYDLDEPQVLMTQNWDIHFNGLEAVDTEESTLKSSESDQQYTLTAKNYDGKLITLPLIYVNATGIFGGDDADKRLILTPGKDNITKKDYFIINSVDPVTASNNARSYVVQYKGSDKVTDTSPKVYFNVLGVGDQEVTMATSIAATGTLCTLKLGGSSFTFVNESTCQTADCSISLTSTDFSDGAPTNNSVSNYIRTQYNALINITDKNASSEESISIAAAGVFAPLNSSWIVNVTIDDTSRDDDDLTLPESVYQISMGNGSGTSLEVTSSVTHSNTWVTDPVTSDKSTYRTVAGVLIDDTDTSSAPAQLTVKIPKSIVRPMVYLGSGDVNVTTTASGNATELGTPMYKDTDKSSYAGKNLIVVGGSCINSAAAELLGGAACGEAFTTKTGVGAGQFLIKSFDKSGKVALLVAGYNAEDTTKAVTYLKNKPVDTTVGKAYKGTSATEATLITSTTTTNSSA